MTVTDQFREFANQIAERAQRRRVGKARCCCLSRVRRARMLTPSLACELAHARSGRVSDCFRARQPLARF
jgi:hypothetical protein